MMRLVPDKGDLLRLNLALREVAESVGQPEELLQEVATRAAYPAVAEIFDNEGYGAWAGLTPTYAAWKAEHFSELPILERTGNLRTSLTLPNAPDSVTTYDRDGALAIGSSVPYFGAVNDIRPIAQFQEQHFDDMLTAATDHIGQVAAAEGFEVSTS